MTIGEWQVIVVAQGARDDEAYRRGYETGLAIADVLIGPGGLLVLAVLVLAVVLAVRAATRRDRDQLAAARRRLEARARDTRAEDV